MSGRHFRRLMDRYDEEGREGLRDRRLGKVSPRRAPASELARMQNRSRGSSGERRGSARWADEEREGLSLSQNRGVQPHAQELSRCPTSPSARCVSA